MSSYDPIPPQVRSRLKDLRLTSRRAVGLHGIGLHHSRSRGAGLEFAQYRAYEPGDELRQMAERSDRSGLASQFANEANPEVHRRTTAEEIWADTDGGVDVVVAGIGTGGTITGVGQVLKERRPEVKMFAVGLTVVSAVVFGLLAAVFVLRPPGESSIPARGLPEAALQDLWQQGAGTDGGDVGAGGEVVVRGVGRPVDHAVPGLDAQHPHPFSSAGLLMIRMRHGAPKPPESRALISPPVAVRISSSMSSAHFRPHSG